MTNREYKRLGDYIREVNVRNREEQVTNLLGLSIEKRFIPSIANTIGTDMSTYKIVYPMQFAYVPVTSRNGEKITIALYKGSESAIISQAYTVFEITNPNVLLPEYLMMWFRRSEFDRYARFHSHGSAREVFDWNEMCNVYLPIPNIDEQRKIVAEYQAVEQRIENNNRLIKALEDTAQAIYHHTFVENIDPENLPEGWKWGTLADMAECFDSKRIPIAEYDRVNMKGEYPYYGASSIMDYVNDYLFDGIYLLMGEDGSVRTEDNYPVLQYVSGKFWVNNHAHVLKGINGCSTELLYVLLAKTNIGKYVTGGVQEKINQKNMFSIPVILLPAKELEQLNSQVEPLIKNINAINKENNVLAKFKKVLLSKLS